MSVMAYEGGCLCGAVRYRAEPPLRPIVVCHCGQCRRSHGGPAPYAAARAGQLQIVGPAGLAWYESSPGIRRGFCRRCGSSLFWRRDQGEAVSIAAGSFDGDPGLRIAGHIHVAAAVAWTARSDGLPAWPAGDDGTLTSLPA